MIPSRRPSAVSRSRVAVGLLWGALWLAGCSQAPRPGARPAVAPEETALPPVAKEEAEEFTLANYGDDGRKQWEISGNSADLGAEVIQLKHLTATAYSPRANVTLTAQQGTYDRQERTVQLRRDVQAVTSEGTTLTTSSLDWDANRQVASTNEWTTVARDNLVVQGLGAQGFRLLQRVKFYERVHVDVKPSTIITCDGLLAVDYGRHWARFNRNVHVQDPRGDIWADRMDVQIHPQTHQISRVHCWGHVIIQQASQVANARRAVYRQREGTIRLIGHPKVLFYSDHGSDRGSAGAALAPPPHGVHETAPAGGLFVLPVPGAGGFKTAREAANDRPAAP